MQPQFITLSRQAKDITGQKFGRLVAIGPIGRDKQGKPVWLCQCDCGNVCQVRSGHLIHKQTKSCGCTSNDSITTHGLRKHLLYSTWRDMLGRCKDTYRNRENYKDRGITVCEAWRNSIEAFIAYAEQLPHAGEKGYSLDRIDNSLGYFPGNIRFATIAEQNRNTRRNRFIMYLGRSQCIADWAKELSIPVGVIYYRLKVGWGVERALTQPIGNYRKKSPK